MVLNEVELFTLASKALHPPMPAFHPSRALVKRTFHLVENRSPTRPASHPTPVFVLAIASLCNSLSFLSTAPPHLYLLRSYPHLKPSSQSTSSIIKPFQPLAGVAQWTECRPENQRVAGLFSVGTHAWVAGQVPGGGCTRGNHTLVFLSLSFSLPSPLSKIK